MPFDIVVQCYLVHSIELDTLAYIIDILLQSFDFDNNGCFFSFCRFKLHFVLMKSEELLQPHKMK